MKNYIILLLVILLLNSFCSTESNNPLEKKIVNRDKLDNGIYAKLNTDKGDILISLFYKDVPLSVANFIGLAEGTIKNSVKKRGVPFFDGMLFHRVVKNFVIQTGDPKGDGNGGPGYDFPIEINPKLKHDSPGTVGMARDNNPDSNGSQFYITHRATPHLDGSYIVFGKVIKGMDTVNKIEKGDKLISVKILRIGNEEKKYIVNDTIFEKLKKNQSEKNQKQKELNRLIVVKRIEKVLSIVEKGDFLKTKSGIKYLILKEGKGEKIKEGKTYQARYIGFTKDKKYIIGSYLDGVFFLFRLESEGLTKGLKESLKDMKIGEKRIVIIPPNLNISNKKRKEDPAKMPIIYELELIL